MQQKIIGVLYITYDGLCDPLGQSQVITYMKELAKKDVHIVILSFEKKGCLEEGEIFKAIKSELDRHKIIWKYLRYHNTPRIFATIYDIARGVGNGFFLIKMHSLNITHARGYVSAFIAFFLKGLIKLKFIFDMRGFWVDEKVDAGFWKKESMGYRIAKFLEKGMLNLADRVVVLTEKARLFLASRGIKTGAEIDVIPTCVNPKVFEPLNGPKKEFLRNKLVILYSGSIGTFYGFTEIVRFFRFFLEKEPNAFFLALINTEPHLAENILQKHGIAECLYKVLNLNYLKVPEWVREADVSLMLYHRENSYAGCCPTKFAESLACGVPVIINKNIGDCDEIIKKERIGFILDDLKDHDLRKVRDDFLLSLRERDKMRVRCRIVAERFFSLDSGVDKYLEIYNKLV
ncbi:MAG: glycosyltransferase [Candidatus Omnitrophota bacterium]